MMSPKDLCTINFLDQIVDAKEVLKIAAEGVPRICSYRNHAREAIDSIEDGSFSQEKVAEWMKQLEPFTILEVFGVVTI